MNQIVLEPPAPIVQPSMLCRSHEYDRLLIVWFGAADIPRYKLHRINGNQYAFVDLNTSECWANGVFDTPYEAIETALRGHNAVIYSFSNFRELIKFLQTRKGATDK